MTREEFEDAALAHMAKFPGRAFSAFDLARVTGSDRSRATQAREWLRGLEAGGKLVAVPDAEDPRVTRWRIADGAAA